MKKDWQKSFIDQIGEAEFRKSLRQSQADVAIEGLDLSDADCEYMVELAKRALNEEHMVELIKQWCLKDTSLKPGFS